MKCPECKKKMIDDENMYPDESSVEVCLECGIAIKRVNIDKDELEIFREVYKD